MNFVLSLSIIVWVLPNIFVFYCKYFMKHFEYDKLENSYQGILLF